MSSGRRRNKALKIVEPPPEEDEEIENSSSEDESDDRSSDAEETGSHGGMSLDVLAQVASEKLNEEPVRRKKPKRVPSGRITQRSIRSRDVLPLEQISKLTDKALVNLFSEMTANEMTRNYTFTCYLMPEKCKAKFTSFGNESKARLLVKTHLFNHVCDLIDDANDPKKPQRMKFTAEPVSARKKRLTAVQAAKKKPPKAVVEEPVPIEKKGNTNGKKSSKKTKDKAKPEPKVTAVDKPKKTKKGSIYQRIRSIQPDFGEGTTIVHSVDGKPREESMSRITSWSTYIEEEESGSDVDTRQTKRFRLDKEILYKLHSGEQTRKRESTGTQKKKRHGNRSSDKEENQTDSMIRMNEQFIIDLMNRSQPHHDHCYTTIFGKKKGIDMMHFDLDSSSDDDGEENSSASSNRVSASNRRPISGTTNMTMTDPNKISLQLKGGVMMQTSASIPIGVAELTRLSQNIDGYPIVSAEEVVGTENQVGDFSNTSRPYPPMPKDPLARQGKMLVLEEQNSSSDEEKDAKSGKKKKLVEGSTEWERKTALKCIRELKGKGRTDRAVLKCKICKNKTFTASATLMYHYRSHAGIKPFICLVCNTTFTRQHSLNYHMLIHNNMSRFKCPECSREFRHPSHFKEHLRRHTGETPFECADCPLKFKTRNTYKRHLKTRHGKLLTASGIYIMPKDEFEKVKTKRYRSRDFKTIEDYAKIDLSGLRKYEKHERSILKGPEAYIEKTEEDTMVDVESVENANLAAANHSSTNTGFIKIS